MAAAHQQQRAADDTRRGSRHAASLARNLGWCVAITCACGGGEAQPIVDAAPCVDEAHDEDGDGVGDRCDICPTAPDPDQRDTTERALGKFEDGVGDACDPRVALSGDTLAALHTFASASGADAWTGTGWSIAGDAAHASAEARWTSRTREQGSGLYVHVLAAEVEWRAGGVLEIAADGDGSVGFACKLLADRDGDGMDELEARELGGEAATRGIGIALATSQPVALTAWRTVDLEQRGRLTCRVSVDGELTELQLATVDGASNGNYGIAAANAAVELGAVVVYTSPYLSKNPPSAPSR